MTERITSAEVREVATDLDVDWPWRCRWLLRLADQMEADEEGMDDPTTTNAVLQKRVASMYRIEAERDALAAKVATLEDALRPFAIPQLPAEAISPDDHPLYEFYAPTGYRVITYGDIRRVRKEVDHD